MSPSPRPPVRKSLPPAGPRIPPGTVLRLHATTALSRLMREDHEGARELLSRRSRSDVEEITRAGERLAALARLVLADFESGAA